MKNTTTQILDNIDRASAVLILGHSEPDGDSLGTQLVMSDFVRYRNKKVAIRNEGDIPGRYNFLPGIENIKSPDVPLDFDPDLVIILDCTNRYRVGAAEKFIADGIQIINIDHHIHNSEFGNVNYVMENASSVGEIVYDILSDTDYELTMDNALQFYTAILTDTGRFHFSSTTPRALRICADLIEKGIDPREITDEIYFSMTPEQLRLRGKVMGNAEVFVDGQICALTLTRKMLEECKSVMADFEGLVEYSMQLRGVTIGVLFKEVSPYETKLSIRSRNGFDVAKLAREFGGGGHANAAGTAIHKPVDEAKMSFIQTAERMLAENED